MIKIFNTSEETGKLEKISSIQDGCWISLVNPDKEEIVKISENIGVDVEFIEGILDDNEKPRIDEEDGCKMFLLDIPVVSKKNNSESVKTIPFGILLVRDEYIVTICAAKNAIIWDFMNGRVKEFYTSKKSRFIIQMIYRIAVSYLKELKVISRKIELAEDQILKATKNEELINFLIIENSLTYITAALRSNSVVLDKILKGNVILLQEDDQELLEDAIIENNQGIAMADLYRGILSSLTDTVATIISNNLNGIMKFLAGITIVFSIPTMVSSFMGMNVKLGKFASGNRAFLNIFLISLVLSLVVALLLKKKNML